MLMTLWIKKGKVKMADGTSTNTTPTFRRSKQPWAGVSTTVAGAIDKAGAGGVRSASDGCDSWRQVLPWDVILPPLYSAFPVCKVVPR